jgi:NAD(P)-dependent dehydrogenase (short-subunit alcohol dehydrogenase family)
VDAPLDFTGQAVLVTGGSRGIGRTIAVRFRDAGARVAVCGRKDPEELPDGLEFVVADVRDPEQVERLFDEVAGRLGRLDVLVNNAGGSPPADSATASPKFTTAIIGLNLLAPYYCSQRAYAVMSAQDEGGSIVNITSVSGMRPSPGTAAYGAAKAGLINLTQTLAMEWAPKVRVNALTGGLIATELADLFYGDEAAQAAVAATVPMGRLGSPADIADACLYLASPLARWVTGTNLVVHGGGERPPYLDAVESGRSGTA